MELKEFVTETLIAIHDAITQAINRIEAAGGKGTINPHWLEEGSWDKNVEKVDFDIATSVSDKAAGTAKVGIKVFTVVDVGGDGSKSREHSVANKVKFSVPMIFPASARYARTPKPE